jgi:hypothetical protein
MVSSLSWARRFRVDEQRLCARPGCGEPAVATLRFQPTQRAAWLIDVDQSVAHSERDLCARHATALVLPRGWELYDGRAGAIADDVVTPDVPAVRRPAMRARRPDVAPVPDAVDDPEPRAEADAEPGPDQPEPEPEQPHVAGEALSDVLDARTPLLRRAFQNLWPLSDDS